eukprot:UN16734
MFFLSFFKACKKILIHDFKLAKNHFIVFGFF